jgi:hypothetical protein
MNFRLLLPAVLVFAALPLHAEEEKKEGKKTPAVTQDGWMKKVAHSLWPFGKKPLAADAPVPKGSQSGKGWKQLVPTISIEPMPLKLSEVRTMKVTLQLANHGKKLAQLEFPTTQRIEILVTDEAGKRIEQWSEDQAFQNEQTLVAINPNERLEYVATVATRDLKPGQSYTVEGFFPNFDQLRASKKITPLP